MRGGDEIPTVGYGSGNDGIPGDTRRGTKQDRRDHRRGPVRYERSRGFATDTAPFHGRAQTRSEYPDTSMRRYRPRCIRRNGFRLRSRCRRPDRSLRADGLDHRSGGSGRTFLRIGQGPDGRVVRRGLRRLPVLQSPAAKDVRRRVLQRIDARRCRTDRRSSRS
jgi:hypothetical protein